MKQIKINKIHFVEDTQLHKVYLGNGTMFEFKNKRTADNFLRKTGKFLTQIYFETWKQYTQVNTHYDSIFLLLDGYVITEREIQENLQSIRDLLNRLYIKPECGCPPNHNYLSFINLNKCLSYIQQTVKLLDRITKQRSDTILIYNFNSIITHCEFLKSELSKFGKIESSYLFLVPENIPVTKEIDVIQLQTA